MLAYSPCRILEDARKLTRAVDVSLAEMLFVFSHAQLNEVEKLLWLTLAAHATRDTFSCIFSYAQISHCIQQSPENVHRAITRLMAMGFLDTEDRLDSFSHLQLMKRCRFSVQLPLEGLLVVKKTSSNALREQQRLPRQPITINLLNNRLRKMPPP